ncbi:MAG: V-type ATP synthase subunit I [Candidatus Omnitrophota bacterium]
MGVARINKVEILGLKQDKERLLACLQKLEMVELISSSAQGPGIQIQAPDEKEINLLEIEEAISYLNSFKEKSGFWEGMVKFKPLVYNEQLKGVLDNFDYVKLLQGISELRSHLRELHQHKEKLIQERQLLSPWRKLSLSLDQVKATHNCGVFLGVLNTGGYTALEEECRQKEIAFFSDIVHQDQASIFLSVIYLKQDFEQLEAVFKGHHFNFVTLPRHNQAVRDRLLEINFAVLIADDEAENIKYKIKGLAQEQFKLALIYDYLANIRGIRQADGHLAKQQFTFSLAGWIKARDIAILEKAVSGFEGIVLFITEPVEGPDEIPVALENNFLIQPFEFITKIYGLPKYNELDPTPFLAPFFFVYFGFCVSDAGYGLLIILMCFFVLKKIHLGPQGVRFFRLFLFCGISTVIAGALTGSWFGNLLDMASQNNKFMFSIKRLKDSLVILDPLKQPTRLLGVALCLGIFQVWFGNIVAAIGNFKNKRYLAIVLDQIVTLVFLSGLTGLGLIFLKLGDARNAALFKYLALAGSVSLVLTQGRSENGLGAKLFFGAYSLYSGLSGYLSDVLSYSRLWALGLVTGVMANTINLISVQFSAIFFSTFAFLGRINSVRVVLGAAIILSVFILGHTVAFFMNLLGAFVHPVRLQFVEFFSKFFKSGGRPFRPFKVETKYINLE